MDREYLKHITSSPYVDEGLFDNWLSKHRFSWGRKPTGQNTPTPNGTSNTPANLSSTSTVENKEKQNADDLATLIAATLNIISTRVIEDKNSRPYYSKPLADGNYYLPKTLDEPYPLQHSSEWNPPHPPEEPENLNTLPDDNPEKIAYLKDKEEYEKKLKSYRYVPQRNASGEIIGYTYKLTTPDTIATVPKPIPFLPTTPEPSLQMEDDTMDVPDKSKPSGNNQNTDNSDIELTGEFLYDFASLYRKHHEHSIEVTKTPVKVVFSNGRDTIIRVFWHWKDNVNIILVQLLKDGKSWKTSELLKFYDDEANPQSPYHESNFNIAQFLEHINPNAKKLYAKVGSDKDNEVKAALKIFRPAAYAVIRRKGVMEFKSYKSLRFHVPDEWKKQKQGDSHWGDVTLLRGKFGKYPKGDTIPFSVIHKYFYTKKNEVVHTKFADALEEAEYWDSYRGIKDHFKEPAPIISDDNFDIDDDDDDDGGPEKTDIPQPDIPPQPPTPSTSTSSTLTWTSVPNAIEAYKKVRSIKKFTLEDPVWIDLAQRAVNDLGTDKTIDEYESYLLSNSPSSEVPEPSSDSTSNQEELPNEAPTSKDKSTLKKQKEFVQINKDFESMGLPTLDNIEQLDRLNIYKGIHNNKIKKEAINNIENDDDERDKYYNANVAEKYPTSDKRDIWAKLISQAKSPPTSSKKKPKKEPNVSEEMINPFQWSNFI